MSWSGAAGSPAEPSAGHNDIKGYFVYFLINVRIPGDFHNKGTVFLIKWKSEPDSNVFVNCTVLPFGNDYAA